MVDLKRQNRLRFCQLTDIVRVTNFYIVLWSRNRQA